MAIYWRLLSEKFSFPSLQVTMIGEIGKLLTELQQERADLGFCLFVNGSRLEKYSLTIKTH